MPQDAFLCVYIPLLLYTEVHALLSRELYSMLACWLLPFVGFTLRLLKSKFKNYHISSFIFVQFKYQSEVMVGILCLCGL